MIHLIVVLYYNIYGRLLNYKLQEFMARKNSTKSMQNKSQQPEKI